MEENSAGADHVRHGQRVFRRPIKRVPCPAPAAPVRQRSTARLRQSIGAIRRWCSVVRHNDLGFHVRDEDWSEPDRLPSDLVELLAQISGIEPARYRLSNSGSSLREAISAHGTGSRDARCVPARLSQMENMPTWLAPPMSQCSESPMYALDTHRKGITTPVGVQPSRHRIVIVGADHGGGMLREVGHSAGHRVRFVGHAEHAAIIDLVAEHHQARYRQVLPLQHMGYALLRTAEPRVRRRRRCVSRRRSTWAWTCCCGCRRGMTLHRCARAQAGSTFSGGGDKSFAHAEIG